MRRSTVILASALTLAALAPSVHADEGMWTWNRLPLDVLEARHGFKPDAAWLERARLSSIRLAQGCSASFVSKDGLVMTNHHCVHRCVEELSTPTSDLVANGFLAKTRAEERRCPNLEVNQLLSIEDVTARVEAAAANLSDAEANAARKAEMTRIEAACNARGKDLRCDVVTLYNGGVYDLYTYRRHQDVRLVWAPELAAAFFGGDPDNFMFPRYNLDASFLRVYSGVVGPDGTRSVSAKPLKTKQHLAWSKDALNAGDLTFVAGNPGSTSRSKTIAELEAFRDTGLLFRLLHLSELRGQLVQYARRSPEHARHSKHLLFSVENGLKAFRGEAAALAAPGFLDALRDREAALRAKVAADPALAATHGPAWDAVAAASARSRDLFLPYTMLEGAQGFRSELFTFARHLLRAAAERPLSDAERLREYTSARLPGLEQALFSEAPVVAEFEIFRLTFGLTRLREVLGPDDPNVKALLGAESPEQVAVRLVGGTRLADPAERRRLYALDAAALSAEADAMLGFARAVDGAARAIRKTWEDEVEGPARSGQTRIAAARFKLEGTSVYPDATFTPRLSFGTVKGWSEAGRTVAPFTTIGGAFSRHTGADPFALPASWLAARDRLNPETPYNFATDNDIIGGNSGSPVFNRKGEVVGLIFDGNIHSLGGEFGFDPATNRAVAVDARAIVHALEVVHGASHLVRELRGK